MMHTKKGSNKKTFLILFIVIGILVVIEIINLYSSSVHRSKLPTAEHKILLTIETGEAFLVPSEDYVKLKKYIIYYDGSVEMSVDRNLSGKTEENYQIKEEDLQELYHLLKTDFKKYGEDERAVDSIGYRFKYYDPKGNLIHEVLGETNIKCLRRILDIVRQA